MVLVQTSLFERDEQEHVLAGSHHALVPTPGVELQSEQRRDLLSHIVPPSLCASGRRRLTHWLHREIVTGSLECNFEPRSRPAGVSTKPTMQNVGKLIARGVLCW